MAEETKNNSKDNADKTKKEILCEDNGLSKKAKILMG